MGVFGFRGGHGKTRNSKQRITTDKYRSSHPANSFDYQMDLIGEISQCIGMVGFKHEGRKASPSMGNVGFSMQDQTIAQIFTKNLLIKPA